MNRTFHAKIRIGSYVLLAALLAVAIYSTWQVNGIMLGASLLLMVIVIERMIHTCYVVSGDGMLTISKGRFVKDKVIPLDDISRIDKVETMRVFGKSLNSFLFVVTKSGEQYAVIPHQEEEFVKYIMKKKTTK